MSGARRWENADVVVLKGALAARREERPAPNPVPGAEARTRSDERRVGVADIDAAGARKCQGRQASSVVSPTENPPSGTFGEVSFRPSRVTIHGRTW